MSENMNKDTIIISDLRNFCLKIIFGQLTCGVIVGWMDGVGGFGKERLFVKYYYQKNGF